MYWFDTVGIPAAMRHLNDDGYEPATIHIAEKRLKMGMFSDFKKAYDAGLNGEDVDFDTSYERGQRKKADRAERKAARTRIRCPRCKQSDYQVIGAKKQLSIGKGVAGALLAGSLGAVGGAAGLGKQGKTELLCNNCGCRFRLK